MEATMTTKTTQQSPLALIGGVGGAIGGWLLARYCWASLLIPGVATVLLLIVLTKTGFGPKYFRGAISVTAGHLVWFVVAAVILGLWAPVILDIVALTVGIIWLCLRPGLIAAIFLGAVQLVSLGVNLAALASAPVGGPEHRALIVHCLLRAIALVCLGVGYYQLRQHRNAQAEVESAAGPLVQG